MRFTPASKIHWQIIAFALLSWLGEYVHNRFDLPQLTLLSPENSIPALISVLLVLAWCFLPFKRATTIALLFWAFVQLLGGGILSVIPFPFWPFYPAQTLFHYSMHIIYILTQLPLIIVLIQQLKMLSAKSVPVRGAL